MLFCKWRSFLNSFCHLFQMDFLPLIFLFTDQRDTKTMNFLVCSKISFHTEKPVINPFIFGADLREGMRTTVVCSILSGELPISITWYKDGQLLQMVHPEAETVRLGDFTSSLKIGNIGRRHTGNYTCRASHSNFPHIYSTFTTHMTVLG